MRPASIWPNRSGGSSGAARHAQPQHVHRRAEVLRLEPGLRAYRRVAAVGTHHQRGREPREIAVRRVRRVQAHHAGHGLGQQRERLGLHPTRGWKFGSLRAWPAMKSRKSHCGIIIKELCSGWARGGSPRDAPAPSRCGWTGRATRRAGGAGTPSSSPELVHHVQRRRVDRAFAAEVAQEVGGASRQHDDVPRPRRAQQEAVAHRRAGRAATPAMQQSVFIRFRFSVQPARVRQRPARRPFGAARKGCTFTWSTGL